LETAAVIKMRIAYESASLGTDLDWDRRKGDCEKDECADTKGKPLRADRPFVIECGWVFQFYQKEDQCKKKEPLHMMPNCKGGKKREDYAVDRRAVLVEERVDNMSSIKLSHRQQVQSGHEQTRPASKTDRV